MPMSFNEMSWREKSQWFLLATLLFVYGRYFADVLSGHGANVAAGDVARFIRAVVTLVTLQVAGHVALAIIDRRALEQGVQRDERDERIDLRAARISSYVLAAGVFVALSVALQVPGNFAFVHVAFGALVLSHVCELAIRIALYRRGT